MGKNTVHGGPTTIADIATTDAAPPVDEGQEIAASPEPVIEPEPVEPTPEPEPVEPAPKPGPELPTPDDLKAAWVEAATQAGLPRRAAEGMTKAQLIAELTRGDG